MRWFSKAVIAAAFFGISGAALAQDLIPERRVVVTQDQDLPGGDIASVFDTTIEACERAALTNPRATAYVYNTRNGSCPPPTTPARGALFQGAYSAYAIEAISRYGALKGGWLAVRRLSKCHPLGGHGYDPIFMPEGSDKTFAEMEDAEKDAISHRARAFGLFVNDVLGGGVEH